MKHVLCPHCKTYRIVTAKMPKDVIVVIPCPACHELVVMFRNKVGGLSRRILEQGSYEERKSHLAEVIAQFLEPGMFSLEEGLSGDSGSEGEHDEEADSAESGNEGAPPSPISETEIERFIQVDLKRIDDPAYFKRHFG